MIVNALGLRGCVGSEHQRRTHACEHHHSSSLGLYHIGDLSAHTLVTGEEKPRQGKVNELFVYNDFARVNA